MLHKRSKRPELPPLHERDVLGQLETSSSQRLLLGRFDARQITAAMRRSAVVAALEKRGLFEPEIIIEPIEDFEEALKVFASHANNRELIAELRLREVMYSLDPGQQPREPMLVIDWLMLQNPFRTFTANRPPLPGQEHPGLGMAKIALRSIIAYCRWQKLSGIINFPEFFHNAWFYRKVFTFYNVAYAGVFQALQRDLQPLTITEKSWAIEIGCVRDITNGDYFSWSPEAQLLPLRTHLRQQLRSHDFRERIRQHAEARRFQLDQKRFETLYPEYQSGRRSLM